MQDANFNKNVFINCPFDKEYEPILQAILFCLIYLGFSPRISSSTIDGTVSRLERIIELIENSQYSIHDLSRCQAKERGEFYRLNMPFELGLDYGCKKFGEDKWSDKKILILEEERYRYQASISDFSGRDIETHGNDFQTAIRKVRNWLVSEAAVKKIAAGKIYSKYIEFQQWYYEKQLANGFSEEDIQDYPTNELLTEMNQWVVSKN